MVSVTALAGGGLSLVSMVLLAVCLRQRSALRAFVEEPLHGEIGLPEIPQCAASFALTPGSPSTQVAVVPQPQPVPWSVGSDLFREIGERVHEIVLLHGDAILYANPQFAALAGLPAEQLVGRHLSELVVAEQKQPVSDNLRQRLAGEVVAERYEIDLLGD